MAVGSFWAMLWIFPGVWTFVDYDNTFLHLLPFLLTGGCLGAGMLASLAHLGTKKNAWRALGHWRKSWLSREVLLTGLFGMGWLFTLVGSVIWHHGTVEVMAFTAALGLGLVDSMAKVYRLRSIPGWNTWRTNAGFLVSALLLGQSLMGTLLAYELRITGSPMPASQWSDHEQQPLILLLVQFSLMQKVSSPSPFREIRIGMLVAGAALVTASSILSGAGN